MLRRFLGFKCFIFSILFIFFLVDIERSFASEQFKGRWTTYYTAIQPRIAHKVDFAYLDDEVTFDIELFISAKPFPRSRLFILFVSKVKDAQLNQDGDTLKLTLTVDKVMEKEQTPYLINKWNKEKKCGFSNWERDVYQDVTGKKCESSEDTEDATEDKFSKGDLIHVSVRKAGNRIYLDDFDSDSDTLIDPRVPLFLVSPN